MEQNIAKWEDCGRDDLNIIPTMIKNGFTPVFSHKDKMHNRTSFENCPHDAVSFVKGTLNVWKIYGKEDFSWQTADLIDGYYVNHKPLKEISELVNG